jgi:hypothetical protein
MSIRKLPDGSILLIRPTPELIKKYDSEMLRIKGEYRWLPKDNYKSLEQFPYRDCNFYIVGKGRSLDLLKDHHFDGISPVLCINHSILKIQSLNIKNPIFLIQQDSFNEIILNERVQVLLSQNIKGFYQKQREKYLFVPANFRVNTNALTAICAIEIIKLFNGQHVTMYGFDACITGETDYAKTVGHPVGGNPNRFLSHRLTLDCQLGKIPRSWIIPDSGSYQISAFACFKDEALYLKEWLDFHIMQGFDHFFLCNNNSTDHYRYVLQPYLQAGQVTLFDIQDLAPQKKAYEYAMEHFKPLTKWLAFIDIDEFLHCRNGRSLSDNLSDYQDNIAVHWMFFGSNGRDSYSSDPVTSRFTRRGKVDKHVKTIVREGNSKFRTPHNFSGPRTVDENNILIDSPYPAHGTCEKFGIAHYGCKSKEEYQWKMAKGRVDINKSRTLEEFAMYDQNQIKYRTLKNMMLNYGPKITLVTCTGDRPEAFKLCELMMERQIYRGHIQWIVVDDGEVPTICTLGQQYIRRIKEEHDPVHTLIPNLKEALPLIKGEYLFFIEDDDYYSPEYLIKYMKALETLDLVGAIRSRYYNVPLRKYYVFDNRDHASLCQTAINTRWLPLIIDECQDNDPILDKRIWKNPQIKRTLLDQPLCIGMKGLPGRKGLLMGHKNEDHFIPDEKLKVITEWMGSDYLLYYPQDIKP